MAENEAFEKVNLS